MSVCGSQSCACALTSNSLTISGNGSAGMPWQVEAIQGQVVTSGTRPSSSINGTQIYETDTGRIVIYDGTNWVIKAGAMPSCKAEAQALQSIASGSAQPVALSTEIFDTDGFHTGTNAFMTVPSGLGGDYVCIGQGTWAANVNSYRVILLSVTNNAGAAVQNSSPRQGGHAMVSTVAGNSVSMVFRLAAAAVVTLQVIHAVGSPLDLSTATLEMHMLRHIPSLV